MVDRLVHCDAAWPTSSWQAATTVCSGSCSAPLTASSAAPAPVRPPLPVGSASLQRDCRSREIGQHQLWLQGTPRAEHAA